MSRSATVRWLEGTALNALTSSKGEHAPHNTRFGTTRGSLSTFLLNRSWRYQLAELGIHLRNPTDMLTVPLPQPLQFLYPVLRLPLWAWRHSIRRGRSPKVGVAKRFPDWTAVGFRACDHRPRAVEPCLALSRCHR